MVSVAIAGTGNVSKQILKALAAKPHKHTVVVLSRNPNPFITSLGFTVKVVDYASPASLEAALQGVHTVISTIQISADSFIESNVALVAAAKAVGVHRFAPSEWATGGRINDICDAYGGKKVVWSAAKAAGFECAAFCPGVFMNYLAHGSPHPEVAEKCFDGLPDFAYVVDVAAGAAQIPGTGDEKIALTTTQDVGRFVAAALDMPDGTWQDEMGMAGYVGSYNDVVRVAEKVTGKKIKVEYTSKEELEKGIAVAEGFMPRFYLQARLASVLGAGAPGNYVLNDATGVKAQSLEDFLQMWWGQ